MDLSVRGRQELDACRDIWKGGYYEGDPLDPMGPSSYGLLGFMSVLHVTYLMCIKPYVGASTRVLEIGPGRGAWTRCFVATGASEILCLDALPAEHNGFWQYVGKRDNVRYVQVSDFTLSVVPDDHFDYFFTFGVFCHISPSLIAEYMKNLYPKLRKGAHGFMMIADYDKRNAAIDRVERLSIFRVFESWAFKGRRYAAFKPVWNSLSRLIPPHVDAKMDKGEPDVPRPDRWYHLGIANATEMLRSYGYEVLEPDMGVNHRDPVVHFRKP